MCTPQTTWVAIVCHGWTWIMRNVLSVVVSFILCVGTNTIIFILTLLSFHHSNMKPVAANQINLMCSYRSSMLIMTPFPVLYSSSMRGLTCFCKCNIWPDDLSSSLTCGMHRTWPPWKISWWPLHYSIPKLSVAVLVIVVFSLFGSMLVFVSFHVLPLICSLT